MASINDNQPDERFYEESVTLANNEQSNTVSKFNQMESPSTPVNPFVAAGIIPLHFFKLVGWLVMSTLGSMKKNWRRSRKTMKQRR